MGIAKNPSLFFNTRTFLLLLRLCKYNNGGHNMDKIIYLLVDYGIIGIMIAAFFEAIFLPIPMDLISIPSYLLNPNKVFLYLTALIIFSIIGSISGYYLGKLFAKPLRNKFSSSVNFNRLKGLYDKNSFLTILSSSFTPIAYEAYVLSAGIFNIGFRKFIIAAIISRVIRHLPQGILIALYGDTLLSYLENYTLIIAFFIFIIILIKYLFTNFKSSYE